MIRDSDGLLSTVDGSLASRRVGLIGTGFMGSAHLAAWRALGIIPAAILTRRGARTSIGVSIGAETEVIADLSRFLRSVDVVDICSPSDTHEVLALAAAEAGKPTLCEKPLALGVASSLRIVEGFARAAVPLQVGHVVRFFPEYAAARTLVLRGDIGDPAVVRLARVSSAPVRAAENWFADDRRSGGLFLDLMIHDLDYARWLAGDVTSVYARASHGPRSHGIAILTHASGTISHVEASWAAPSPVFRTHVEIAGSRGVLHFDSEESAAIKTALHVGASSATTGLSDVDLGDNPFENELQHFLDVVDGHREPVLTPIDAVAAVQLGEAATASASVGLAMPIEPLESGV